MPNYLKMADEAGDAVRRTIRAYHGSPHDFDKFDSRKIGTGEGAQAFGHGLYFAEKKAVADEYRRSLSAKAFQESFGNAGLPDDADPEEVMDAIKSFSRDQEELLRRLSAESWLGFDYPSQAIRQAFSRGLVDRYEVSPELVRARDKLGTGYEVEIGFPESALLDWDAPMGRQPKGVADFLQSRKYEEQPFTGRNLVSELIYELAGKYTKLPHKEMERLAGKEASELLMDAGIPGIRYLDQGSRSAVQGTRNYVMFPGTEDKIRILRKYGLLAPAAASQAFSED